MREVVYLMSGAAHMPYLVISLKTLRQWWPGRVTVYCYPESYSFGQLVTADKRFDSPETGQVNCVRWEPVPVQKQKNTQFLNKIKMVQSHKAKTVFYLDADTTIHGDLTPMFELAEQKGFVATQFSKWISTGGVIRNRLTRLLQFPEIDTDAVQYVMRHELPSVNGGVFSCSPQSPVLSRWFEWSWASQQIFICDEAVLHILQHTMPESLYVQTGGRWNCSHRYQSDIIDPFIYHYHGDSNLRPDKSPQAYAQWWPMYQEAIIENLGGIGEWHFDINNKWLRALEGTK